MEDISEAEIKDLLKLTIINYNNSYSFTMMESEKTEK